MPRTYVQFERPSAGDTTPFVRATGRTRCVHPNTGQLCNMGVLVRLNRALHLGPREPTRTAFTASRHQIVGEPAGLEEVDIPRAVQVPVVRRIDKIAVSVCMWARQAARTPG